MKNKEITIAVVGATGLVGRMMARVLTEESQKFPILKSAKYVLFNRSGGNVIEICGKPHVTQELNEKSAARVKADFALFSAGADIARQFAPIFALNGAIVIDNSSCFRRDVDKLLVVPEVNWEVLNSAKPGIIIANPNCTTIGALVALKPLDDVFGLKRVVYSTYQAISGAGANPTFAWPIDGNVIPYIDGEEAKMDHETNKILGHPVAVSATCIRIPVANCHTISINAEFEKPIDAASAMETLRSYVKHRGAEAGLVVLSEDRLPMPIHTNGHNEVFVGRVRDDKSRANTINLITCSDNIRKGAATNAVQIMERFL